MINKLLVATDQVDCEVEGFGKACVGGGIAVRINDVSEAKIEIDPVFVGISAKVKSKGTILKFTQLCEGSTFVRAYFGL